MTRPPPPYLPAGRDRVVIATEPARLLRCGMVGASDDKAIDTFLSRARPTDLVERQQTLEEVERGLFGRRAQAKTRTFGRFVLLEKLGRGGGGLVHAAYDPQLDRKVAIKLLHSDRSSDPLQTRQRLLREAQAIASFSHPNILAIYDVGTFEDAEAHDLGLSSGGVYLVMELVDGPDLRTWLRQSTRSVKEILDAFVGAAEGIAAAHEQGIIHRDIKPSNILMGGDGRTRVLDFGLARRVGESSSSSSEPGPDPTPLDRPLTDHGTILGTPAYMAPEQHEAAETDERTDQYAFCVSLFEALYGERPFSGKDLEDLAAAKRTTRLPVPTKGRRVRRWLRDILARGLSVNPDDRYPHMRSLIAALRDDPMRKWGRRSAVAGVVVLLGGLGVTTYRARAQQAGVCDATEELAGIWDEATRSRVRHTFTSSALPYAPRVLADVEASLDRWAAAWTTARETACRSALVDKSHSMSEMSRAALCLDRHLQRVGGIVRVLAEADDTVVDSADRIVQTLPDLSACAVRPDDDAPAGAAVQHRGELLDIEGRLAEASALMNAGQLDEAVAMSRDALQKSRSVSDDQLVARALHLLGEIAQMQSRSDESERLLRQSILASERAEDELSTIETSLLLAFGLGIHRARPDEGIYLVDQCEARLAKHGDLPVLRGRVAYMRGRLLEARGDHEDALHSFEQALSLYEPAVGSDDLRTVAAINNVGVAHDRLGHYEEALHHYERTLEARRILYGYDHPDTANALGNVGATYDSLGRYADAIEPLRRSIAIYTGAYGGEHRLVAWYRANLGVALGHLGRYEEARDELRAALRIRTRVLGPTHPHTAMAHTELADAWVDLGRADEALASADTAISLLAEWPDRSLMGNARHARGRALLALERPRADVEGELGRAIALLEGALGRDHVETTDAHLTLVRAALTWGDLELAREHAERAAHILDAAQVDNARRAPARTLLAEIRALAGGDHGP